MIDEPWIEFPVSVRRERSCLTLALRQMKLCLLDFSRPIHSFTVLRTEIQTKDLLRRLRRMKWRFRIDDAAKMSISLGPGAVFSWWWCLSLFFSLSQIHSPSFLRHIPDRRDDDCARQVVENSQPLCNGSRIPIPCSGIPTIILWATAVSTKAAQLTVVLQSDVELFFMFRPKNGCVRGIRPSRSCPGLWPQARKE